MKAIHAINAVLWRAGEQTLKLQTDKPNDYYTRGRPHAPRVIRWLVISMIDPETQKCIASKITSGLVTINYVSLCFLCKTPLFPF